jgi:hypothetical protein
MELISFINKKVLIRSRGAGVHFGILLEKEGNEVRLKNACRLWSWSGALSLSEVSSKGVDIKNSKISIPVEEIIIMECLEIHPLKETNLSILCK